MIRLVILGAGQMGAVAGTLVNREAYDLICYGDNHPENSRIRGEARVMTVEAALAARPDEVLVSVVGKDRAEALYRQARDAGFQGRIWNINDFIERIDLRRGAAVRMAARLSGISGAAAELGVYKGDFAQLINVLFPERRLYLFDTFTGFDERDIPAESRNRFSAAKAGDFGDTCVEYVKSRMKYPEQVIFRKGYFPETCSGIEEVFAFVSLDADLYTPTLEGLEWFLPRMSPGGVIFLHDYGNLRFHGAAQALHDYEERHGTLALVPLPDLHGSAVIVK